MIAPPGAGIGTRRTAALPSLYAFFTATTPAPAPTAPAVSINAEQRLYVIPCVAGTPRRPRVVGYSCLGFENLERRLTAVAAWIGRSLEEEASAPGTLHRYALYQSVLDEAAAQAAQAAQTNTRCPAQLTPQLMGVEGRRVEVVDCYGETRRFTVGRSMGWMPCHLEIKSEASSGGPAVMCTPFQSVRVVR